MSSRSSTPSVVSRRALLKAAVFFPAVVSLSACGTERSVGEPDPTPTPLPNLPGIPSSSEPTPTLPPFDAPNHIVSGFDPVPGAEEATWADVVGDNIVTLHGAELLHSGNRGSVVVNGDTHTNVRERIGQQGLLNVTLTVGRASRGRCRGVDVLEVTAEDNALSGAQFVGAVVVAMDEKSLPLAGKANVAANNNLSGLARNDENVGQQTYVLGSIETNQNASLAVVTCFQTPAGEYKLAAIPFKMSHYVYPDNGQWQSFPNGGSEFYLTANAQSAEVILQQPQRAAGLEVCDAGINT